MENNVLYIETEDLGEFSITLTNDQIDIISENAIALFDSSKERLDEYRDEEYWDSEEDEEQVDWSFCFSGVRNQDIEEVILDEDFRVNEIQNKTPLGFAILSAGLTSSFGANSISLGYVQVVKAEGDYFGD